MLGLYYLSKRKAALFLAFENNWRQPRVRQTAPTGACSVWRHPFPSFYSPYSQCWHALCFSGTYRVPISLHIVLGKKQNGVARQQSASWQWTWIWLTLVCEQRHWCLDTRQTWLWLTKPSLCAHEYANERPCD